MTSPTTLSTQRCFNHESREAVCKCLSCSRFYCRECVVDHEGRLTCASCLKAAIAPRAATTMRLAGVRTAVLAITGFVLIWFSFYSMGRTLLLLPTSFEEWIGQ